MAKLPTSRWRATSIEGYEIQAVEFGSGDDVLVLLHGLSGSSRWWMRNVPALADRFRLLVPDLVGFGRTRYDGTLPSPAELAKLLVRWMAELGANRAHVAGHSMGGQIAIHLAAANPACVDRLVLVDAAGIPRPRTPAHLLRFAADIAPIWRWGDPRFLPVIMGDAVRAGPRTIARAAAHILDDDVRPLLSQIQSPTLIVWGDRDRWVPVAHASEFRQRLPNATMAVLPRAGHNPMVDQPEEFNKLVLGFLDD